uniref:Uncharacterized protein n=1 Tax=Lepeophtheirus salmonis TaxID=72036 RepID=A0A0K2SXZ9_LEPSM
MTDSEVQTRLSGKYMEAAEAEAFMYSGEFPSRRKYLFYTNLLFIRSFRIISSI